MRIVFLSDFFHSVPSVVSDWCVHISKLLWEILQLYLKIFILWNIFNFHRNMLKWVGGKRATTEKADLGTYLMLTVSFATLPKVFKLKRLLLHGNQEKFFDGSPAAMFGMLLCLIICSDTDLVSQNIYTFMYICSRTWNISSSSSLMLPLRFSHHFTVFSPSSFLCLVFSALS